MSWYYSYQIVVFASLHIAVMGSRTCVCVTSADIVPLVQEDFNRLALVVRSHWCDELNQTVLALWFYKNYCTPPFNSWYYTVTGTLCVCMRVCLRGNVCVLMCVWVCQCGIRQYHLCVLLVGTPGFAAHQQAVEAAHMEEQRVDMQGITHQPMSKLLGVTYLNMYKRNGAETKFPLCSSLTHTRDVPITKLARKVLLEHNHLDHEQVGSVIITHVVCLVTLSCFYYSCCLSSYQESFYTGIKFELRFFSPAISEFTRYDQLRNFEAWSENFVWKFGSENCCFVTLQRSYETTIEIAHFDPV